MHRARSQAVQNTGGAGAAPPHLTCKQPPHAAPTCAPPAPPPPPVLVCRRAREGEVGQGPVHRRHRLRPHRHLSRSEFPAVEGPRVQNTRRGRPRPLPPPAAAAAAATRSHSSTSPNPQQQQFFVATRGGGRGPTLAAGRPARRSTLTSRADGLQPTCSPHVAAPLPGCTTNTPHRLRHSFRPPITLPLFLTSSSYCLLPPPLCSPLTRLLCSSAFSPAWHVHSAPGVQAAPAL